MTATKTFLLALATAFALLLAVPAARCRLHRRARHESGDVAAREPQPAPGGNAGRRSADRSRSARPRRRIGRWRRDVEAIAGAGELGPRRRVFRRREAGLGRRARRRSAAYGRRRRLVGGATRRPQGERIAGRVCGAQGRRPARLRGCQASACGGEALRATGSRQAVPRCLVRRREQRLCRGRLQSDLSHGRRRKDAGSRGSIAPRTPSSSTCIRSDPLAAVCSLPGRAGSC